MMRILNALAGLFCGLVVCAAAQAAPTTINFGFSGGPGNTVQTSFVFNGTGLPLFVPAPTVTAQGTLDGNPQSGFAGNGTPLGVNQSVGGLGVRSLNPGSPTFGETYGVGGGGEVVDSVGNGVERLNFTVGFGSLLTDFSLQTILFGHTGDYQTTGSPFPRITDPDNTQDFSIYKNGALIASFSWDLLSSFDVSFVAALQNLVSGDIIGIQSITDTSTNTNRFAVSGLVFQAELLPEPASMLAWGLIAGVVGIGARMRKRLAKVS